MSKYPKIIREILHSKNPDLTMRENEVIRAYLTYGESAYLKLHIAQRTMYEHIYRICEKNGYETPMRHWESRKYILLKMDETREEKCQ